MGATHPKISYVHFNTAGNWLFPKYAYALKAAGAEVEIACLDQPRDAHVIGSYDLQVPATVFGYTRPVTAGWKPGRELQRILGRLAKFLAIRRLTQHLTKLKPTHLIAGDPPSLAVCDLVSERMGARFIYTPFEFYPKVAGANARQWRRYQAYERHHIERAAEVVFLGDSILNYYVKQYPGIANKSHVVYSGWPTCAEVVELRLRREAGISGEKRIVLYQGVIEADRGLLNAVAALTFLSESTLLVILGYGAGKAELQERALELKVSDRVLIMPPVPQPELMSYTRDADIGIIPLLDVKSHSYACPGKLFEYIAAGLPLVVSDMPDLKRIVQKYGLGEVYAWNSVEGLATALSKLLNNDSYRNACSANANRAQLQDLSWERQRARFCEAVFRS